MPSYRGEYVSGHPSFNSTSTAATAPRDGPYSITAPDILYSEEDDAAIDDFHREMGKILFHTTLCDGKLTCT